MRNKVFKRARAPGRAAPIVNNAKSNHLTHNLLDYLRGRDIFATVGETDTPRSN